MDTADEEPCIPHGFGRILRDDTGLITGFESSKTEEREVAEVEGLQLEVDADQTVHQKWVGSLSSSSAKGKDVLRGELIELFSFGTLSRPITFF